MRHNFGLSQKNEDTGKNETKRTVKPCVAASFTTQQIQSIWRVCRMRMHRAHRKQKRANASGWWRVKTVAVWHMPNANLFATERQQTTKIYNTLDDNKTHQLITFINMMRALFFSVVVVVTLYPFCSVVNKNVATRTVFKCIFALFALKHELMMLLMILRTIFVWLMSCLAPTLALLRSTQHGSVWLSHRLRGHMTPWRERFGDPRRNAIQFMLPKWTLKTLIQSQSRGNYLEIICNWKQIHGIFVISIFHDIVQCDLVICFTLNIFEQSRMSQRELNEENTKTNWKMTMAMNRKIQNYTNRYVFVVVCLSYAHCSNDQMLNAHSSLQFDCVLGEEIL